MEFEFTVESLDKYLPHSTCFLTQWSVTQEYYHFSFSTGQNFSFLYWTQTFIPAFTKACKMNRCSVSHSIFLQMHLNINVTLMAMSIQSSPSVGISTSPRLFRSVTVRSDLSPFVPHGHVTVSYCTLIFVQPITPSVYSFWANTSIKVANFLFLFSHVNTFLYDSLYLVTWQSTEWSSRIGTEMSVWPQ